MKLNVKMSRIIKNCKTCEIKYKDCDCFLEYRNFIYNLIEYKRLCCNEKYQKKFDESLRKQFLKTYKLSNRVVLILMNTSMIGKNSMKFHYL